MAAGLKTKAVERAQMMADAPGWLLSGALILAALGLGSGMARGQDSNAPTEAPPAAATEEAAPVFFTPTPGPDGIIISHGISTFGDLALPPDFPNLPYVNVDAPKGGELSLGTFGGFDSMNPFTIMGRPAVGSSMMLETILTGTLDEIGASYCLLCTTMEYPVDRSWVIFNLRPEARFSDGTPLTAEDVVFSYQTFLERGLSDFRQVFAEQVEGAEILGPHRVKFTFREGVPKRDLPADVGGLNVFSKAQFERENIDLEQSQKTAFIGSGPYRFASSTAGTSIAYERVQDYWGADLPIRRGTSNFDRISYQYFGDPNAAFEAFKAGLYTFRVESTARQWAEGYDFPAIRSGAVRKDTLASGTKASGQSFFFNLRRAAWQDPRVRDAIGMMFNFEWSNKALFYGLYTRVESFWENSWLEAEGPPSPAEVAILQPLVSEGLLPEAILTDGPVMAPVSDPDRQLDRNNLRRAAALLDEAGWPVGSPPPVARFSPMVAGGILLAAALLAAGIVTRPRFAARRPLAAGVALVAVAGIGWWAFAEVAAPEDGFRRNDKGEVLRFAVLEDNPQFERILAPFVENLRGLGIDARIEMVDEAQYEVRTRNPSYDFDLTGFFALTNYISGSELKQFYGSATADVSFFNKAGLKDPAIDRLTDIVMAADTRDSLTDATRALDRVLRAKGFRIPMWYNADHWVAYFDMYEHPENLPSQDLGVASIWWQNAEKAAALRASGALK